MLQQHTLHSAGRCMAQPRMARSVLPQLARSVRTKAASVTDVSVFLEEIAVAQTPKRLPAYLRVLQAAGATPLLPTQREGLHPLLVPLARLPPAEGGALGAGSGERVACLLRWPEPSKHKSMSLPVVAMERGARRVGLIARSVDEHLHRLLAEEDLNGSGARPLAGMAGELGGELYKAGDAAAAGFTGPKANLYVVRKVGMFPDVCEGLAAGHLKRGDDTSALVASEWYMRNGYFPGWARPYEFASELLTQLTKRDEEARDMARVALRLPWWSLSKEFSEVQAVAALSGRTPEDTRWALSEEAAAQAQAAAMGRTAMKEPRTKAEVALDKAAGLLDFVAAGARPSYDDVRGELAAAYREAGLTDVADFIIMAS